MLYSLVLLVAIASTISASALPRHNGRIVGGEPTTIETYPHQVAIESFGNLFCGGTIISAHYIITAGHCASEPMSLKVRAGTTYEGKGGTVHQVTQVHVHEKYLETQYESSINDIAIMRVRQPFVFDNTRQPIKLFEAGEEALPGTMAVITGWGDTENGIPTQLQTASVPIVSKKVCDTAYKKFGGLAEGQICAGYYGVGGKDACQGDSGGPLLINGRLAGITSYGEGCGEPEYPGVYTEVAAFRDWVNKTAKV